MAQKKFPPFGQLEFGMLDAASEAAHSPELLIGGYYDCKSAAKDISMMRGWVLVGAKGAGKSAVLEHLALQWAGSPMNFISRWALTTFPIADVTKLQVGSTPGPSATCAAWQFQLLLKVFASLIGDQGASYGGQVTTFHRDLVRLGLLEGEDLRTKFFDWSKTTVRFQVQGVGAEGGFGDAGATAVQLIELLKRAISEISTDSQHLLAVDGLDSFFASSDDQWNSFGGLLDATNEVNVFLRGTSLRATVLIAVREDMFTSAESFDSAKMDDQTIRLSWSQDDQAEGESLWGMISQKARVSVRNPNDWLTLGDIRKAYLSEMVNRQLSVADYLLGYTRYLPRDMVALMNAVKKVHGGSGQVRVEQARRAVRSYSEGYFLAEIKNNLTKAFTSTGGTKTNDFLEELSTLDSPYFTSAELEKSLEGVLTSTEIRQLLRQLYRAGAIGVITRRNSVQHTNFSYRRAAGGGFKYKGRFLLHRALIEAWNIPRA
ncbi:P-loop ATPase, Sll1717 family [Leucobacter chromiireducens]|nr:hypothetical protein [Leucobacter chromiireducens]